MSSLQRLITVLSLLVAAASLLAAVHVALKSAELVRELKELKEAALEVEKLRRELERKLKEIGNLTKIIEERGWQEAAEEVRAIVYILPSKASSPKWREMYGDRIYFYAYANLSEYAGYIDRDFGVISRVYNTVVIVIPGEDTSEFYGNLRVVDSLAAKRNLRVMWAIFPKWKYGAESDYLSPNTRMNAVVLNLMSFLSTLNSTWKIAVWYGWSDRCNPRDIYEFYESLPVDLKPLYAAWIDQPFVECTKGLSSRNPPFLVVTELYSEEAIRDFSNLYEHQMVITGYSGAGSPGEWLKGVSRKLSFVKGADRLLGFWIFYDINDGHGEQYAAFRPEWGAMPDPYRGTTVEP